MPEAKNTFLKAKMNQDLDDRLLPNGEYRTAQNVLVGKSEEDSVGTLQNIKGNEILDSLVRPANSFIIGYLMDTTKNRIYAFFTDSVNNHSIRYHAIYSTGSNPLPWVTLVEGAFLNFSANFPILNVNLLEDLLFWTDNNNQPRKINVISAETAGYYTEEHQISVAKYNPYQPISLVKQEIEEVAGTPTTTVFDVAENANIVPGMIVLSKSDITSVITANNYITVSTVNTASGTTTVTLSSAASSITAGDVMYFLSSTMTDQSNNASWPGDPSYLESRFVRFSYRFKFDDNEYSIFAPFTQVAFIPKQKGYFVNGQEESALSSTILDWFENGINNIDLIIPLPDILQNISSSYKIKEIDILYKESDQIPVKVIDTITPPSSGADNYYVYSYQSRKPIRTLPEAQTVRVYDKVPVIANTQEIVSNRIVYGNFKTKLTPPPTINYTVNIQKKISEGSATSFVEYPNHTVKQNRNYQVGFVLADKYGRQSDVILSPVLESSDDKGSTIFAPYIQENTPNSGTPDANYMPNGVKGWLGNSLVLNLLSPIVTSGEQDELYAGAIGNGFDVDPSTAVSITDTTYVFNLLPAAFSDVPQAGSYMRGEYIDYVEVESVDSSSAPTYTVTTSGRVNDIYLNNKQLTSSINDTKFAYTIDVNGWYSYKIVVKQTEQEYYNVYLPSAIGATGFTTNSTDTSALVSYITLINDNINKVPRDLAEVGPDQKQYRSSVELFGRVQPTFVSSTHGNKQYFPTRTADTSTAVGNTKDLVGTPSDTEAVFQYDSDPILARITTNKQFGIAPADFTTTATGRFQLAVYETEPVVSNLDIYWETSHAGLISDLNAETLTGFDGPIGLAGWGDFLNENKVAGTDVTGGFSPIDSDGNTISGYTINLDSVVNRANPPVAQGTNRFTMQFDQTNNEYFIQLEEEQVFTDQSNTLGVFDFTFTVQDTNPSSTWNSAQFTETLTLSNTDPSFDAQPAQQYYYFFEDSTTSFEIRDFLVNNTARNGSAGASLNQNQLVWSIGGTNANLFSINSTTGVLTPTLAGVAAGFNTYNITVTLKDANGITGSGSVTQPYKIIKGFTPTNVPLGYQKPILQTDKQLGGNIIPGMPAPTEREFIYYVAGGPLAESALPGDPTITATFIKRFGDSANHALTQGAIQFGVEDIYASQGPGSTFTTPYGFDLTVTPYYRSSSTGNWVATTSTFVPPRDLNNRAFITGSTPATTSVTNNSASVPTYRSNIFYAQDTPGEYAWVVKVTKTAGTQLLVNFEGVLRDLHYTNSTNGGLRIYKYRIYQNNGTGWTNTPSSVAGSDIVDVYSEQPLAEYNTKFWTDINLSTVYVPPVGNKYYVVQLANLSAPFSDRKFNNYTTQGSILVGLPILLNPSGEVLRNAEPNVDTLKMNSSFALTASSPIGRQNTSTDKYYSWP